jgi:outer membrane lipoprotein SlyB
MEEEKKEVKTGLKTTEFWLILAATVVGVFQGAELGGTAGAIIATVASILGALGYGVIRTAAKK